MSELFGFPIVSDISLKSLNRPVSQNAGEIRGFLDRADYMLSIAESSLAEVPLTDTDKPGFKRYIKRTPLGVVLVIAPWKYGYFICQRC